MARILVTGASRGVGRATVTAALDGGHAVRALSRTRPNDADRRADWIAGSATDDRTMLAAVDCMDAVVTCLGHPPSLAPVSLFSRAASATVDAMQAKSVRRLIALTGLGAGDSRDVGNPITTKLLRPLLLGQVYADKDREERIIRDSGLDWTIVRPGILTRLPAQGTWRVLVEPAEWEAGFISRADIAGFLVTQVADRSLVGKTPVVIA